MKLENLTTPNFLVDLDVLENNINTIQNTCNLYNKSLFPMTKTHKSTQIAKLQLDAGAEGFLTGTLDEAELLIKKGFEKIIYAYPVAGYENIKRAVDIGKRGELILSLDCISQVKPISDELKKEKISLKVLIIVNSGLNRFGVNKDNILDLAREIYKYENLKLVGIATHPGQVYASNSLEDVKKCAEDEVNIMEENRSILVRNGFKVDMVAIGSTPTFYYSVENEAVNTMRPGNYVFFDNIQRSMGIIDEKSCALTVVSTILSKPREDLFIIDAGSKTLGLDKGAHGNTNIVGYGYIKGEDNLIIEDLSEEVGKVKIVGTTNLKVGDKIEIIPNHACAVANNTDYLIGHRNKKIVEIINIDMRSGRVRKPPIVIIK